MGESDEVDKCLKKTCDYLSNKCCCCCNYRRNNSGACYRWIGGVINVSTAIVAFALECAGSSKGVEIFALICSTFSLAMSITYFINCCC